jgi:hypothetical protein
LKALKISALVLGLIVLGALGFLMISAMKAPKQFLQDFREETSKISNNKVILAYPDELLEKKASLDARLAMSEDDSIGMRINLKERSLYLEINGIVLHRTPILEQKTSSFFKHLSGAEKYVLFRKPLVIDRDESTIVKDKFEVVIAPKDTLEAQARQEVIPDTVLREPIMYRLYFKNGIRIQVTGELPDSVPQFWPRFKFNYDDKVKFLKGLFSSLQHKKPAPFQPTISIVVDAKEAEAIYRAVPKKGNVILELKP